MKRMKKFGPRYGFKKFQEGGLTADEEADLQALKTLQQPDYDVGGPKRRFARGKVKRYSDEGQAHDPGAKKVKSPKRYNKGGGVGSASKRADGCATQGKTRGKMV